MIAERRADQRAVCSTAGAYEDQLVAGIERFFATRIFGPQRLTAFRSQQRVLARRLGHDATAERTRLESQLAAINQRLERQLAAI